MNEELEAKVRTHVAAFARGTSDLIERGELERTLRKRLAAGEPLRVKLGMDPSSPDLHLGHAVQLMKLRDLQELGHRIVLIVGDATAMVGDPSGRNKLRPQLTRDEVEANLLTYERQAGQVIDLERTEVRRNSEWFDAMRFHDVLRLAGRMTVARMIERDTFQKRMEAKEPIGIHEFLYPLMQGWDSVMIRADAELGGTDQLFNLLVGRQLQEQEGQAGQICFTQPLIAGLDGRKMSKSYGNAIQLTDGANDMFGKLMSVEDGAMALWFELLTRLAPEEIARVLAGHPREAKARLGSEVVRFFHGETAARAAREAFDRQFRDREMPDEVPEAAWPESARGQELPLANLLREVGLAPSTSEARRNVSAGGVRVNGEVVNDPMRAFGESELPLVIQRGKRHYVRVVRAKGG